MDTFRAFVVLVLVIIHICSCTADSCYAPPLFWGPECKSTTSIFGSPGHRITYSVSVIQNAGSLICCQGYSPVDKLFHSIGCGSDNFSWTLDWGNFLDIPKIKCKGTPFGAMVTWRF